MINVGLIGRGAISNAHSAAYKRLQEEGVEIKVAAYCDIRESVLEGLDARTYTDVDEFLKNEAGKLDYVDICVPTYLHAEFAIKAMKAGFNVLSEKPMARTPELADEMIRTAEETGKLLMIAHCSRFMGQMDIVRKYMETGELGKIRSAEFWRSGGPVPTGYQNWFRDGKLSGGVILDLQIHDVDIAQQLFGMPKAVSTVAMSALSKDGYDIMTSNLIYDDMFVTIRSDWTIEHDKYDVRGMRFNFEKGYIFNDRSGGPRSVFRLIDTEGNETQLTGYSQDATYYREIKYYLDCLQNNKKPEWNLPEISANNIRIAFAQTKSADLGGARVEL